MSQLHWPARHACDGVQKLDVEVPAYLSIGQAAWAGIANALDLNHPGCVRPEHTSSSRQAMWSICFAKHGAASDLLIFNTSLAEERTVHRTLCRFMPLAALRLVSSMRENRVNDAQARLPKEQRRREQLD